MPGFNLSELLLETLMVLSWNIGIVEKDSILRIKLHTDFACFLLHGNVSKRAKKVKGKS